MRFRPLKPEDVPILEQIEKQSGFPYPKLSDPLIETIVVVVDSEDKPIVAGVAKKLIEIYAYVDSSRSPAVKMEAIGMLHKGMAIVLRELRYNSCEAFIPPSVASKFGRRLERTWRWVKNWQSWTLRF